MFAKVKSVAVFGIDAFLVDVEVNIARGLPAVVIVGLPDAAVKESKDRVKAAMLNCGYDFPSKRITINLAPGDTKKEGPVFELPIALGLLGAQEELKSERLDDYAVVGELSLEGTVRPVKGCLSMAIACKEAGLKGIIVPYENASETSVVEGIDVIPVENLPQLVSFLNEKIDIQPFSVNLDDVFDRYSKYAEDFSDVKGQMHVKRALTIAAAGGHNVLMIGPPGSGKTMLARRLPTIMPMLTPDESIQTTKVYSVAGLIKHNQSLVATRPFRTPHHTISDAGLVGGGTFPKPGEVSLAHNGVLFLDELPEFNRKTLEVLRQPLEDGVVTISRVQSSLTFPAKFMLVAAMNPCPCGFYTDPTRACNCTPRQIQNYLSRISGPLLDRIDIHIEVPSIKYRELKSAADGVTSEDIRKEVMKARLAQYERYRGLKMTVNSHLVSRQIAKYCKITDAAEKLLSRAMTEFTFSARAYHKILKVARTIADLEGSADIDLEHISEAVQYRTLDRSFWG